MDSAPPIKQCSVSRPFEERQHDVSPKNKLDFHTEGEMIPNELSDLISNPQNYTLSDHDYGFLNCGFESEPTSEKVGDLIEMDVNQEPCQPLPCLQNLLESTASSGFGLTSSSWEKPSDVHLDGSSFAVPFVQDDFQNVAQYLELEEEVRGSSSLEFNTDFNQYILDEERNSFGTSINSSINHVLESAVVLSCTKENNSHSSSTTVAKGVSYDLDELKNLKSELEDVKHTAKFMKGWEVLISKAFHLERRTGSKIKIIGHLKSNRYEWSSCNVKSGVKAGSSARPSESIIEAFGQDDHRYAAVILTQKESSLDVRDHEYENQCRTGCNKHFEEPNANHDKRSLIIKERYRRDNQLVSFLNGLFEKKIALEDETGASVTIEARYEEYMFTSSNYKEAVSILKARRGKRFVSPIIPVLNGAEPNNSIYTASLPLRVFVQETPVGEGFPPGVQVRFIMNKSKSEESDLLSLRCSSPISDSTLSYQRKDEASSFMSINYKEETSSQHSVNVPKVVDHCYSNMPDNVCLKEVPLENNQFDSNISEVFNEGSPPSKSTLTMKRNSSKEKMQSRRKSSVNAETNTELLCEICKCKTPPSLLSLSTSLLSQYTETLWIRCNDPLCHYLVHPSCLGFKVTEPNQLRQLPPYFCLNHRLDFHIK